MMTAVPPDTVVEGQDLGHYWEFHIVMKVCYHLESFWASSRRWEDS